MWKLQHTQVSLLNHAAKPKLIRRIEMELMSMKASEVIVTFLLSVAKHRRIAAGKNLVHGDMHFLF